MATAASPPVGLAPRRARIIALRILGSLLALVGVAFSAMIAMSIPEAAKDGHAVHEIGTVGGMLAAAIPLGYAVFRPREAEAFKAAVGGAAALGIALSVLIGSFDFSIVINLLIVVAAAFIPGRWWPERFESKALLGLGILGGVLFAKYAWTNFQNQVNGAPTDQHVEFFHYIGQTWFVAVITLFAIVAAGRAAGWRLVGWFAGVAAVALGAMSLAYGKAPSALPTLGAIAAIAGGLAYIGVVEKEHRAPSGR